MVGSALVRRLSTEDCEILTIGKEHLDLTHQIETLDWMDENRPEVVFLAAARVGSVQSAKRQAAQFLYENLAIQNNVISAAWRTGVKRLIFTGSSAVYPNIADRAIKEDMLLGGPPDEASQWYALAKITGIKLCEAFNKQYGCNFISAVPNNAYGPVDDFTPEQARVVAALLRKAHEAKLNNFSAMEVWGTGHPLRELLYVEDLADALVYVAKYAQRPLVNIGSGLEVSIRELAEAICKVVGFGGDLTFLTDKPDGAPRKLLDASQLESLGWIPSTGLEEGLSKTYAWFLDNVATA